jgi:hypothetical protein
MAGAGFHPVSSGRSLRMRMRTWLCVAVLGLVVVPAMARPAEESASPPTLIVRIHSLDRLLHEVRQLAGLAGRKDEAQKLDSALHEHLPKGFEGVDGKRPLGLYGRVDENLMDSTAVVLVPIADEKAFLGLLESHGIKATKDSEGVYSFTPENSPVSVYFRFANGYAYATAREKAALAKDKLIAPEKVLPPGQEETLSASFRVDQIPDVFKQILLSQAELQGANAEEKQTSGETSAQHALKVQAVRQITRHLASVVKDGGEVGLHFNLDAKEKALVAEVTIAGKPGSKLAEVIASLSHAQSQFAGMLKPDAAANILVHASLPADVRKALSPVIDEAMRGILTKEKDEHKRTQAEHLLKAIAPTLKAGELDAAVVLTGPTAKQHYTVVAAFKVRDGQQLDQAVRDLLKQLPESERAKISLDAETAGDLKIHRVNAQKDMDEEARRVFGNHPFYVAARNDAVFIAGGAEGLSALRQAATAPAQAAPPLELAFSMSRLAPTIKENADAVKSAAGQAFGANQGHDKLQVTLQGGEALTLRFSIGTPVVRFFSLVEKEKKGKKD